MSVSLCISLSLPGRGNRSAAWAKVLSSSLLFCVSGADKAIVRKRGGRKGMCYSHRQVVWSRDGREDR